MFLVEAVPTLLVVAMFEAGCGALNTQVFFLPDGATSSWWEVLVPQTLGEAKSTDQAHGAFLTPCGGKPNTKVTMSGSDWPDGPGGAGYPGKAPGGGQDTPAKVPGFRVCTFVIATSVRVITCHEKQLWRPSVSA